MSDTAAARAADDFGRLIEALGRQADASRRTAELIESKALPLLERIALALERTSSIVSAAPVLVSNGQSRGIPEFRIAIDQGQWSEAEAIVRELAIIRSDDPAIVALQEQLSRSRQFAIEDHRQRIEAARLANDPDGAISSRDDLAKILHGEAIQEVDRSLVKWLMGVIQRRLRTGTIRVDVVALATRVAESFGGTTEGASLHASLPTLRRSAGLCPKCAEPYVGVGDACPKCLAASSAATPPAFVPEDPEETEGADEEVSGEPIDLNNERLWKTP